jgi:predicted RNA-binding Zn-ribbon protein involved in translation (DUF1610 family)
MTGELATAYKSGSQRARVVTESWGEQNLYCPNCPSPKLNRLSHNTKASDFNCPDCGFWYQLKGQKSRIVTIQLSSIFYLRSSNSPAHPQLRLSALRRNQT